MQKPYFQLHALVVVLAFTAVLGHLINLSAPVLVSWRTGIAALVFLLVIRPKSSPTTAPHTKTALATGILLGAHWMTFFAAIKLSNITICLTGLATTSVFTALAEAIQEKRLPRPFELLIGAIMIPSMVMIVGVAETHLLGLLIAIFSAMLAASFTVINKALVRSGMAPAAITQYEMLGAFLTCLLTSLTMQLPLAAWIPHGLDWLWLFILAIGCTVIAYEWNIKLLRHFSAFETTLAINFEPVYGIIMAALLFGEHKQLDPLFLLGAAIILAANFAKPLAILIKRRKSSSQE
ncbi:DMT family transporter [Rubritalea tangerina]|uniref:DMT family transporter n=1 Tax=Rubritalea tangerina TaxID=430798 RepID=A0ABW4Z622_9BACT